MRSPSRSSGSFDTANDRKLTMARYGDLYVNDVTGERAVVLRGDEDAPDQPMLVHLRVGPGGAVAGEHLHPALQERFLVLDGELETKVDGRRRTLREREAVTVPAGAWHDWWNASDEPVDVLVELTPPSPRFELAIATGFGLANAGRTNAKGVPSLLQAALMGAEFSDVLVRKHPPALVQKIAFGVLGFVARRRGLKAIYPEYIGRHGSVEPDPEVLAAAGLEALIRG
jgi:quercetin dioxygenase-like cupin family protein